MAPRPPAARGFTLAERRSLHFERVSLWMVLMVAVIAATISFRALTATGHLMGLDWASPLLPLAIDGFAIACSVGIVRSQGAGERGSARVSEWVGLFIALGLSIAGNVQHALISRAPQVPVLLAGLFAAAVPIIVAYGIHVYGRAMARGISAHVLAEDPDKLHFDVHHLGQDGAPAKAGAARTPARTAPRAAPSQRASAPTPNAPSATPSAPTGAPAPRAASGEAKTRARWAYEEMVAADHVKPTASVIGEQLAGMPGCPSPGALRKWVAEWWATDPRNPDVELHAADPTPDADLPPAPPVRAVG